MVRGAALAGRRDECHARAGALCPPPRDWDKGGGGGRGAEAAWLGICSSPGPVLRPARILRAARNTHSALTGFLAAPQRGQNRIEGNQGPKGNLALISSVEKLRLSRSVWSQDCPVQPESRPR
ncbi:stannin isoform X1 [Rattus norvegicus]|uniref:stannin isoform X1 n=1 Tax=Rattus norvegicus TaxID=10116 RepID=UPI0004E48483